MTETVAAPPPVAESTIPIDRLVRVYRKIRGQINAKTEAYEAELAQLQTQLSAVQNELKNRMLALGVTSFNTPEGVAILGTQVRYSTNDWDSFKTFCKEHDVLDLFEKRIAQNNMSQFLKENPTLFPPGLNANTAYVIRVRKPTNT